MKFSIITLGCKVNTYESEAMKELLLAKSFKYEEEYINSDIVIVNTCSVTNMADNKSKKIIRRIKRENEKSILVVCGCSSQNNTSEYQEMDIDILLGNKDKSKIVELINEYLETHNKYIKIYSERNLEFESMNVKKFTSQTRAFLKVQDGCNNFCSYCIIPYVRGSIRSKDFNECLKEARILVNNGHKEIVLTGIHTGSYNSNGKDLVDLIHELSLIDELKQIRISSIEITELNDKFMDELRNNSKICNHLHIPLQAGSNYILKKMNRKYDLEYYRNKIKIIRSIRPNISITTDVIVGHPYEDEIYFNESYEFCKNINFAKIHVFPYSLRTGTVASKMPYQVAEHDKQIRAGKLIELSEIQEESYYKKYVGTLVNVLVEQAGEAYSIGHTSNYLKVRINKKLSQGDFIEAYISKYEDNELVSN